MKRPMREPKPHSFGVLSKSRALLLYVVFAIPFCCLEGAFAADCNALMNTNAPYQLQMIKDGMKSFSWQIYRGADLKRRQLSIAKGRILSAAFQANFQLESTDLDGKKILTTYNVPTDRYIWAQDTRVVRGKTTVDGKPLPGPGFEATYAMLPDEVFPLTNCTFAVKHYTVKQTSPSTTMMEEVWFSTELNTVLRMSIATSNTLTGKTTMSNLEAGSVDTEFAPFP